MLVLRLVTTFPAALNVRSIEAVVAGMLKIRRVTLAKRGNSGLYSCHKSRGFSGRLLTSRFFDRKRYYKEIASSKDAVYGGTALSYRIPYRQSLVGNYLQYFIFFSRAEGFFIDADIEAQKLVLILEYSHVMSYRLLIDNTSFKKKR